MAKSATKAASIPDKPAINGGKREAVVAADYYLTAKKVKVVDASKERMQVAQELVAVPVPEMTPGAKKILYWGEEDGDDSSSNSGSSDFESEEEEPITPLVSKILFAGNLSFDIKEDDVRDFFQSAGKIVGLRLATDADGRFKGYGHVEFSSEAEARNALRLNKRELLGRPIRLDRVNERGKNASSDRNNSYSQQCQTVLVTGFDKSLGDDELKGIIKEHFGKCGEITKIVVEDWKTDASKRVAYIDMRGKEAYRKALELNQIKVGGFQLRVESGSLDFKSEEEVGVCIRPINPSVSNILFAGNLSYNVKEDDVRRFFQSAGKIVGVRLATDADGRFKGYGHVEFASEAEALSALRLNKRELLGRPIRLDRANEREKCFSGRCNPS